MHAPVTHPGVPSRTRRTPIGDVSDWVLGAALVLILLSICAVALAYVLLLILI